MLIINELTVSYEDQAPVLERISAELSLPGTYALMGASGLGKSSLLKTMAGLLAPRGGRISGLAHMRVAMLFQENRLLPWMDVLDNVAVVMPVHDPDRAAKLLHDLDIQDIHAFPSVLSGGMQRRVALARTLAYGGDILLLDEPFNGLDMELRQQTAAVLHRESMSIVFSTHEPQDADLMGAHTLMLYRDRLEKIQQKQGKGCP